MVSSTFALAAAAVPIARARVVANRRTAGVSHHAATGLRCESGSLCSSSRHVAPRALTHSVTSGARRSRCSSMLVTAGPQPDTEEEGSALDFPEVCTHYAQQKGRGKKKPLPAVSSDNLFPPKTAWPKGRRGDMKNVTSLTLSVRRTRPPSPPALLPLYSFSPITRNRSTFVRFQAGDRTFSPT